ncbi:hypothetical protein LIER_41091 [Lithospermum erythrorhizon]|uniref:Reverse transcriptase domain-containing protein n=1 Tax=Lithospermum erythrorhizon TaxID=34254 RepID=A0AAV3R8D0_LITER
MPGVDVELSLHRLHADPSFRPVKHKKRNSSGEKNLAIKKERVVNRVFKEQIRRNMEIYVEDILLKSRRSDDHLGNLRETLEVLRSSGLRINPEKCSFGVTSGKFLGFMIRSPKLLTRPEGVEELQMYPAVSEGAISSILVREEKGSQRPIYYVSDVLYGAEESYPLIEKYVFAVVTDARKLKAYFEAHPIKCTARIPEEVQGPREGKLEEIPR